MSLVSARDLQLSYGDTPALDGCSLSVQAAERVAMMACRGRP